MVKETDERGAFTQTAGQKKKKKAKLIFSRVLVPVIVAGGKLFRSYQQFFNA